jgi:hypothetical protein
MVKNENKVRTVDGGHAKSFCVGVLEVIKTSERIVSETRCSGVNEIGALGVLKDLLEARLGMVDGRWRQLLGGEEAWACHAHPVGLVRATWERQSKRESQRRAKRPSVVGGGARAPSRALKLGSIT